MRSGCEAEFQEALREFLQASLAHGGVLGVHMLTPLPGSQLREYAILRTFASASERDAFYRSPLFEAWQIRVAPLTEGAPEYRELTGLEAWFRTAGDLPPRWKMALATLVGVYPTSIALSLTVGELAHTWPFLARTLAIAVSMVAVLTWIAMPLVTRALHGWLNEWQFAERRMPTFAELDEAAPETPVIVLHLYDCAMLNRAALRALGFDSSTPNPPGGLVARDGRGKPTGLLIAEPNAFILYSTIGRAPKLSFPDQVNSSRHFMRELNRFGVTSVSDAGGGWQNFPEDYAVIRQLAENREMTLRVAYSLFAQKAGSELGDYTRWIGMTKPGEGDDMLRVAGAGENLVWSAADFENFLQPRPDLKPIMESELEAVIRALVAARWPFRIHATYDETIERFLGVFERVHREIPFDDLRWFFDHAETISPRNIERTRALGGGIAIQHRMAYQGESFIRRYGREAARACPPVKALLAAGVPVGAGTDGTRVASYHPWTCLYWLTTGRTVGGTQVTAEEGLLSREEALRLYTEGSAWFSGEVERKGRLAVGRLADLAVLGDDYLSCAEERIRRIESVLTVCDGKIVYAAADYAALAPPLPPVSPDWSPAAHQGGYANEAPAAHAQPAVFGADGRLWQTGCGCSV